MRRLLSTALLCTLAILASPELLLAQSAGALGKPIPDGKLAAGTIVIRVVNGSMSKPVSSLEIGLVDESSGKELVVRTGPQGRAEFHNLPEGKTVTAFAKVGDKEISSDPLIVPARGGLRVLMSPTAIEAVAGGASGAGGASAAGGAGPHGAGGPGAGGMPDPRQMSGVARPEQNDPPGQLTIRGIQGKFRNDPIAGRVADPAKGTTVYLVGFGKGGTVTVKSKPVDDEGRVSFGRLAKDNSISYWVLASFARNGSHDRLQSSSIELLPQVGLRLMLAGHAVDSTEPPIDDLPIFRQKKDVIVPGPGEVRIDLAGQAQEAASVELVDAVSGAVVGTQLPSLTAPATEVSGSLAVPVADPALRDGLVQLRVAGPTGPLPDAIVTARAYPMVEGAEALAEVKADASGLINLDSIVPGTDIVLAVTARGKTVSTPPFKSPTKGGVRIIASWRWKEARPSLRASFRGVASGTDKIYYARVVTKSKKLYFSPPFQMVPDRGAVSGALIYPDLLVGFQGGAELDDNRMWFQMRFSIANPSLVPMDTGKRGLLIPLPAGFVGASVADEMSSRITVDADHGFLWKGAFPPGQRDFTAQFALPIDGGAVNFAMPLPYGVYNSHFFIDDIPGMDLTVPASAKRETREGQGGRKFVMLSQINVRAGQTLSFSIRGLPEAPSWKRTSRILVGLGVLALLILGFVSILVTRSRNTGSADDLEDRREQLLARVIAIDEKRAKGKGKSKKGGRDLATERETLVSELEEIYSKLGDAP